MIDLIITHIDSALHDIGLLVNGWTHPRAHAHIFGLLIRLRNFKKFVQICGKERSFTSISVGIEKTVRTCAERIHLCCQVSCTDFYAGLAREVKDDILLMGKKLDEWYYNRKSSTTLTPDAVLDIISFISEALVDVRRLHSSEELCETIEALEEQMSFMKRLISYLATKIRGKSIHDLLAHAEFVTIKAVCLLFTFHDWGDIVSKISIFLQKNLEPVYKTFTLELGRIKLRGTLEKDDDGAFIAMKNFVDSLISNLWDLLRRLDTWTISTRDVQELYGGLRSLRTFLKQPYNLTMKIKEDIGKAVCDAGIFICSLHHEQREGYLSHLLKNLLDTITGILENVAANEPVVPMLNVLEIYPADEVQEIQEAGMSVPGVSSSTDEVVGFEEDEELIVDQLTRGSKQLQIVAIVGMPGLGKTTLATKVYNNPTILFHFHARASCPISQLADKKKVVMDLLHQIDPSVSSQMYEEDLADTLRKRLKGKRYLIFLDDIWDIAAWTFLEESFPDDSVGSRIILTSRQHDVAPHDLMVDGKPYFLRQFNEEESLKLLQRKLSFGLSYDFKMKFVEKCRGLPLIIVLVAGVLKHAEPEGWDELLNCLRNISIMDQCRNTLKLSYEHLPVSLRPCLLYFGSFPENKEISVRRMLRVWIAEGFIPTDGMNSPEDAAEHILNDLTGRSLIMVGKQRSLGGIKTCRIHDLIHDFCFQKAKDENFFHFLREYDELLAFNEPHDIQRLCIHSEAEHFKESKLFCPHASSLILNSSESTQTFIEGLSQRRMSSTLANFKLLKVLDLEQVHFGYRFPREIRQLVQLTFLAILSEGRVVPSWIGDLSNLETLIVLGDSDGILPNSLWDLQKLQYLYFGGHGYLLPTESFDRPFSLQELDRISGVVIPYSKMESQLRKFPNIRRLKFRLQYTWDDGYNFVFPDILSRMQSLTMLYDNHDAVSPHSAIKFAVLSFPANLKKLTLGRFRLSSSNISTIGELPNLEVFKLFRTKLKRKTWKMKEGEFSKLKFLKLVGLELVSWYADDDPFDCLQKLVLEDCFTLREMPSCLDYIPTLEVIEAFDCHYTVIDLVRGIEGRRKELMGDSGLKIIVNNVSPFEFPK